MTAQFVTPAAVNFMAKHGRGLICVPTTSERLQQLGIERMVRQNRETFKTDFQVSVDATHGITTGISAGDRARTIQVMAAGKSGPITLLPERDEVRRLTRAFDQMLDTLSESERQRIGAERIAAWQEVARRIAHEVKNPLTPIRMAVENLRRTRERSPSDLDRALQEESRTILRGSREPASPRSPSRLQRTPKWPWSQDQ